MEKIDWSRPIIIMHDNGFVERVKKVRPYMGIDCEDGDLVLDECWFASKYGEIYGLTDRRAQNEG